MKLKTYTAILLLINSFNTLAGQNIALDKTRVIYIPKDKNTITIYNKSTTPVLVQEKIKINKNNKILENDIEPGFAIPPLFRIEPDSKFTSNIVINGEKLPDDRESLLYLYILSIPSLENGKDKNSINIASESVLKVFYRPSKIQLDKENIANQLYFKYINNDFIIENKSPYYITLSNINLDKESIKLYYDNAMISPFSFVAYHTKYINTKVINFSIINDDGSKKMIEDIKEIQ